MTPTQTRLTTQLVQAGNRYDSATGAISVPIYQTASFAHPSLGKSTGFAIGLLFLSFIFIPMLAFGDAQYLGPIAGQNSAI